MGRSSKYFFGIVFFLTLVSCNTSTEVQGLALPIYGPKSVIDGDTIYHTVGNYSFTDHNHKKFTQEQTEGKVYVADFFFTSCPVQCPLMSSQMKRLATNTSDLNDLLFVSHAIDFVRDSVERINDYRTKNGLDFDNWYFLEAKEEYTSEVATGDYIVISKEDVAAAGGYAHSAFFVLVDKENRIRGYYDGQVTEEVDKLESDLRKLMKIEYGVSTK